MDPSRDWSYILAGSPTLTQSPTYYAVATSYLLRQVLTYNRIASVLSLAGYSLAVSTVYSMQGGQPGSPLDQEVEDS